MKDLDHVIIGWTDLDQLIAWFAAETGVSAARGGAHKGLGTHNAIVSLGGNSYVELLAIDHAQGSDSPTSKALASLTRPTAFGWAFHCHDASQRAASLRAAGLKTRETSMSRLAPNGMELTWDLIFLEHSFGRAIPFFIDWKETPSPSLIAPG